ncbi:hypothetical protein HDU93_000477 [Gonapodya sp. JEL0774]|nr:hypothetical protein HDU93_000477 [Gonapodya sp. JEL0774]
MNPPVTSPLSELAATIELESKHADYYPAAIRTIENSGTAEQVAALHRIEQHPPDKNQNPPTTELYPGLRSPNLPPFHLPTPIPSPVSVSADLYPGVIRQVENAGTEEEVKELKKIEKAV